jgi:hypothetical protein
MDNPSTTGAVPFVDRKRDCGVLKVLGASIQFLVGPQQNEDAPCILKGLSLREFQYPYTVMISSKSSSFFRELRSDGRRSQNALDRG